MKNSKILEKVDLPANGKIAPFVQQEAGQRDRIGKEEEVREYRKSSFKKWPNKFVCQVAK